MEGSAGLVNARGRKKLEGGNQKSEVRIQEVKEFRR
jgi:hypothetical protein